MTLLGLATLLSLVCQRASGESFSLQADVLRDRVTSLSQHSPQDIHFVSPLSIPTQTYDDEQVDLLDTVLVASVDGMFHAVNRTSGAVKWSMTASGEAQVPTGLAPLVRSRNQRDTDNSWDADWDTYVIEPQTGDIYVVPSHRAANEKLHKLGLSVENLVDASPFSFPGDNGRSFIGKKETSMLSIDIRTGKITNFVNVDECRWDDEPGGGDSTSTLGNAWREDDNSDERARRDSPIVTVGRTDYYVTVVVRGKAIQRLAYSTYGPNNVDRGLQSRWTETPDRRYMQSHPRGHLWAFSTDRDDDLNWALPYFEHPIAAIFDIVAVKGRANPVALLQPRPRIAELMTGSSAYYAGLSDRTYVGNVHGALYAMSAAQYPLVSFDTQDRVPAPPAGRPFDESLDRELWEDDCYEPECLTGRWKTHVVSPESRNGRLLPAPDDKLPIEQITQTISTPTATSTKIEGPSVSSIETDVMHGVWASPKAYGPVAALVVAALLWIVVSRTSPSHTAPKKIRYEEPVEKTPADVTPVPATPVPTREILPVVPEALSLPQTARTEIANGTGQLAPDSADPAVTADEASDGEDDDKDENAENVDGQTPRKRRPRKRRRRRTNKANGDQAAISSGEGKEGSQDDVIEDAVIVDVPSLVLPTPAPPPQPVPVSSLVVSETVLGFGSHGTIVYQGSFQGRAVAVKRLLGDFTTLATREVELLQESDDHPHVIRYFFKEHRDNFLYIALELCPASLADVVERPGAHREISCEFDPKRALSQITAGLRHLHSLKIIHRDIKPQNILVSHAKNGVRRMLISDFGLCKKLDSDQTSFLPTMHGALAAGTVGWRAPEILRGDVALDVTMADDGSSQQSQQSRSSVGYSPIAGGSTTAKRLTKSVDVFALGCLFYYVLTNGDHPFGDRFEREINILKNDFHLADLQRLGEEGVEAIDLITTMLDPEPKSRPDTHDILIHPFFWNPGRRLNFLQDASDRFEIMCRSPREEALIELETGAVKVVGHDWHAKLDRLFIENLGKFRKYDGASVQDLMRALRNKKHHYQDMPDNLKRVMGPLPEGFLGYFTRRFPGLFMHIHAVVLRTGLDREPMFRSYFELAEGS